MDGIDYGLNGLTVFLAWDEASICVPISLDSNTDRENLFSLLSYDVFQLKLRIS